MTIWYFYGDIAHRIELGRAKTQTQPEPEPETERNGTERNVTNRIDIYDYLINSIIWPAAAIACHAPSLTPSTTTLPPLHL